jgi:hypothetical protein
MLKLIAIVLPILIDLINRKVKDTDARFWISAGVCMIFGIVINFIETNGFSGIPTVLDLVNGISNSVIIVFGLAQLSYKAIWEQSDIRKDIGLNSKTQNLDP